MSSLKIYLILGLAVLLIGVSFGCKNIFGPSPDEDDTEECEYPLSPATGNVGDTIRSCHFEVTLNWAKYNPVEYRGPRVEVNATIKLVKAMKGKSASIFADSFIIMDNQGNRYEWNGLGGGPFGDDLMEQTILTEGQQVSGTSAITVGKDSSGFTVIFQESQSWQTAGYQDEIKWKLKF